MPPLRAVWHLWLGLFATAWRRLRGQQTRASWPFMFEVVVSGMRRNSAWCAQQPLSVSRAFDEGLASTQPLPKGVNVERGVIAGVNVDVHTPPSPKPGLKMLYLHGGAHLAGSPKTHAELIARLALASQLEVVAVDFRLAPEHAISDAVDDVLVVHEAQTEEVVWAGDSSGGALVYLAAIEARRRGSKLPVRVAALAPWADLRCEDASYEENAGIDWGSQATLRAQAEIVAKGLPLDDPSISPRFADLTGMPPSLIQVGESEIIRDTVVAFAGALEDAGNDVQLQRWPDQVHNFQMLSGFHPDGQTAITELGAFLRGPEQREQAG